MRRLKYVTGFRYYQNDETVTGVSPSPVIDLSTTGRPVKRYDIISARPSRVVGETWAG